MRGLEVEKEEKVERKRFFSAPGRVENLVEVMTLTLEKRSDQHTSHTIIEEKKKLLTFSSLDPRTQSIRPWASRRAKREPASSQDSLPPPQSRTWNSLLESERESWAPWRRPLRLRLSSERRSRGRPQERTRGRHGRHGSGADRLMRRRSVVEEIGGRRRRSRGCATRGSTGEGGRGSLPTRELERRGWCGRSRRSGFVLGEGIIEDQLVAFRPLEVNDEILQKSNVGISEPKAVKREREAFDSPSSHKSDAILSPPSSTAGQLRDVHLLHRRV